jgi:trk system potassium uptake protein
MKVLIAGGGSVGRYMASQLQAAGHSVVIIDSAPSVVKRRVETNEPAGVAWHLGDACEVKALRAAGCEGADVVAAVTGDDEDNLVISLLAKQEFAVPRVVARVNNPKNEWMFTDMWGVDTAVSTPHLLTALVEEAVSVGSYVRLLSLEQGKARIAEVTLAEGSPAIGRPISGLNLPRECAVTAIIRSGHVIVPSAELVLQAGDEVLVVLSGDCDDQIRAALVG